MSRQTLRDSIDIVNRDMQNAENEVKAVNAAAEYITIVEEKSEEKLDNKEIAEELNKEYKTDLTEEDINKIEKVVEAEKSGDIESVGWDKENNDINIDKINDIYENNNMQTENKIEKSETNEEKESFLDKAKEAISNKLEELQQAAQNVDLHAALRNSDNAFDRAQAEFFDQIDEFTQNLHNNKKEQATQDKNEEKYVEIHLKNNNEKENDKDNSSNFKEDEKQNQKVENNKETNNNDKDLNLNNKNMQKDNKELDNYVNKNNENENKQNKEESISKETQEKLEAKADQAQQKEQNQSEKTEKIEKEAQAEISH